MAEEKKKKKQPKLISGDELFGKPKEILRVSPAVDLAIGGGVPKGSWVILSGPPKGGKSSLAVHMIKKFLMQFREGRCLYADVENRLKPIQLTQDGLDRSRIEVLRSTKGNIMMAEDYLNYIEEYNKTYDNRIIVVDSTSSLCSTTEYTNEITGFTRSLGPKLLANFCRKLAPVVPVQDNIIILITHIIANTSGYGAPTMSDSGYKIQFQSDVSLLCKKGKPWEENGKTVGQINTWKTVWTALGAPQGMEITSYLRYYHGIDEIKEMIDIGTDLGLIGKRGAWYDASFMSMSPIKFQKEKAKLVGKEIEKAFTFQGMGKLVDFIQSDKKIQEILYKNLMSMIYNEVPVAK